VTSRAHPGHVTRAVVPLLVALAVWACAAAAVAADASPPGVQLRVLRFVDRSRRAHFRNGTSGLRVLVTEVRYPTRGHPPFPLIVFAHGFAETPDSYARMLETWARAGYVVAAPVFPVESSSAPGGPDENDLVNEPADLSFVISRLTARASVVRPLIDPTRIAVAGQSDGAEAALAAAYDRRFRDRRIDAAIVMSGAALPGFSPPEPGSPPLLAVQGTLDPLNSPSTTADYFRLMRRPKFLLWLLGAAHLEPYTTSDRWASVVRSATTAFLDHYLRGAPLRRLITAGTETGVARVASEP
jgi:dienelactone hydrolase